MHVGCCLPRGQDWPKVANYNGIVRREQGHRKELNDGVEEIVKYDHHDLWNLNDTRLRVP